VIYREKTVIGPDFGGGDDAKSRVLQATNLVELIGQSVKLKRAGRNYLGLCPFHSEKTPSFNVMPEKQFFHCFGCKASGNAIDFVIQRDRVGFKEALISLANAANIELPKWGGSREGESDRQLMLEAISAASGFFENLLRDPQRGKTARDYLASRGFNEESIQRFHIGLAADSWDALLRSPAMKKFAPEKLALAGLVKARVGDNGSGNGFYDTFRNRLMFPIRDEAGRTIAFGARKLRDEDEPKYLNSPESPLFSKGRVAFGMDLARQKIVETRTVAVVEGYTDVIMAHQYGASNVVSVLGTALTADHVRLLKRFADRIVLLFDADSAGEAAVDRAVELFLTQPVQVAIASMPDGKDPDEYLLEHGADGFQKLLDEAQDALAYKWKQLERQFRASADNITGRQKAVEAYLDVIAAARGPDSSIDQMRWGAIILQVAKLTQMPAEDLHGRFKISPSRRTRNDRSSSNRLGRQIGASQVASRRPVQANGDGMPTTKVPDGSPNEGQRGSQQTGTSPTRPAERWIMGALLFEPVRWHQVQTRVQPEDFLDSDLHQLAEIYWEHQRNEGEPVFNEFLGILETLDKKALAIELFSDAQEQVNLEKGLNDAMDNLLWSRTDAERRTRQAALNEKSSDDVEIEQLRRLTELTRAVSQRNENV